MSSASAMLTAVFIACFLSGIETYFLFAAVFNPASISFKICMRIFASRIVTV